MNNEELELYEAEKLPQMMDDLIRIGELVYDARTTKNAVREVNLAKIRVAVSDLKFDLDTLMKATNK